MLWPPVSWYYFFFKFPLNKIQRRKVSSSVPMVAAFNKKNDLLLLLHSAHDKSSDKVFWTPMVSICFLHLVTSGIQISLWKIQIWFSEVPTSKKIYGYHGCPKTLSENFSNALWLGIAELYNNQLQLDLALNDDNGGDISSFIPNGEWDLIGKAKHHHILLHIYWLCQLL